MPARSAGCSGSRAGRAPPCGSGRSDRGHWWRPRARAPHDPGARGRRRAGARRSSASPRSRRRSACARSTTVAGAFAARASSTVRCQSSRCFARSWRSASSALARFVRVSLCAEAWLYERRQASLSASTTRRRGPCSSRSTVSAISPWSSATSASSWLAIASTALSFAISASIVRRRLAFCSARVAISGMAIVSGGFASARRGGRRGARRARHSRTGRGRRRARRVASLGACGGSRTGWARRPTLSKSQRGFRLAVAHAAFRVGVALLPVARRTARRSGARRARAGPRRRCGRPRGR